MVDAHLPEVYTGVAFNVEPFDTAGVAVWSDLSTRYVQTGTASRGQSQYELDQSQTATADVTWYDQDEALNPANPSSPYAPNVVPYRPFLWLVMWPNSGTGNLLAGAGYDGSFESYATTAQVLAWLSALANVAGASVTVETLVGTGAWQGTKAVSLAISTSTTGVGGVQLTLVLIPGRTYTAQVHINQNVARAFQLAVGNQTIAVDAFTRTTANGWGTPTYYGPLWTIVGTAANMSTAGGFAFMSLSAVNTRLTALTAPSPANQLIQDVDQWGTFSVPVIASLNPINISLFSRYVDINNNSQALISFGADSTVTVQLRKNVAGVGSSLGSIILGDGYVAGDSFRVHLRQVGADFQIKVWKVTSPTPEPTPWSLSIVDGSVSAPGKCGPSAILATGNTNTLPVVITWSDYRAIGSIVDTSVGVTSTSGSYQLLKQTFVASQPLHTIQLETQAVPPGAATVLIDGIQVEPGGTANTFTTTGPIIRPPWTRGYIERWPAQWDPESNGYLGIMQGPVVGPFFQLAGVKLGTESFGSIMDKDPRYFWPLSESGQTVRVFGDQSGNGGPSLNRFDDPTYGPAGTFSTGADTGIVGDPGGTGVEISDVNNPNNATILLAGNGIGQDLTGLGGGISVLSWGVTISLWMTSTATAAGLFSGEMVTVFSPNNDSVLSINTVYVGGSQGPLLSFSSNGHGASSTAPASTNSHLDGTPHMYTGTLDFKNDQITLTMYLDGVVYGSAHTVTASTTFATATFHAQFNQMGVAGERNVGAGYTGQVVTMGIFGVYSTIALWNRALSAAEVADMYTAGTGYPNENSGTRVARYLQRAGYTGVQDIGQGLTTMGPSTLAKDTYALSAIMDGPVATELGHFYESQLGVAFRGRQARYLTTTSAFTFGDRVDLGEYPYLGDIKYDDDATYVFNRAVIEREGGATLSAVDQTGKSQMRYSEKTFTRTVGGNNDAEVQDMANWIVANFKDARPRVASITFDAAATRGLTVDDGTLWPMLLKLEQGTRVTLKKRLKAANGGAGLIVSGDFFVEAISPGSINMETGEWLVTLLMSPVPVTGQPWILEDSVYGVLGSTTILGF